MWWHNATLAWRTFITYRLSVLLFSAIIPCRFFERFFICSPHMTYAELELTLRAHDDGHTADLRFRAPNSAADSDLALGVPVVFDLPCLLALSNDWMAYGRELTAQLFADSRMQMAWTRVQGFIQGAKTTLRLRLRIDSGADDLHGLRWELLQDPATGRPLCRSQRVLFVRFLDTSDLAAIVPPAHDHLRALVFIANPHDLTKYHLDSVDVAGEIARARVALGDLPTTVLARQTETLVSDPLPPLHSATLENLTRNLRAGYPLMVLICHGSMMNVSGTDRPYLWLERDDGSSDQVAGETFVQRIADLDPQQRPLLIILAACQTAGRDQHAAVLASIGPQLTRVGVGAVIGMQGNVPMALIEALLPRLLTHLHENGQIDRALALARADLPDDQPWWMPVLYLRMRDGRVWLPPPLASSDLTETALPSDLEALILLLNDPVIHGKLGDFRFALRTARTQIDLVSHYKGLHDRFQQLESSFNVIVRARRRFASDSDIWDELERPMADVQAYIEEILAQMAVPCITASMVGGRLQFTHAQTELAQSLDGRAIPQLERAVTRINSALKRETSRVNTCLVTSAGVLQLDDITQTLVTIRERLASGLPDTAALRGLTQLIAELAELDHDLRLGIDEHNQWQAIDDALRMMADTLLGAPAEIQGVWSDLCLLADPLIGASSERWAITLTSLSAAVSAAFIRDDLADVRRQFVSYQSRASKRFYAVDEALLQVCQRLQETGTRLDLILRTLDKG